MNLRLLLDFPVRNCGYPGLPGAAGVYRPGSARDRRQMLVTLSNGTNWSPGVSEPCIPTSEDSSGSALVATSAQGRPAPPPRPRSAGRTGARPGRTSPRRWPRHGTPPRPGRRARPARWPARHRGPGHGIDVPGPRLAAEQRDPVPQPGDQVHVDPVVRRRVHHSVIGGDVQHRPGREGTGQLLSHLVHVGELVGPGFGLGPEHVAGAVEVRTGSGSPGPGLNPPAPRTPGRRARPCCPRGGK